MVRLPLANSHSRLADKSFEIPSDLDEIPVSTLMFGGLDLQEIIILSTY